MKRRTKWLMLALAMTGVAGAAIGQSESDNRGEAQAAPAAPAGDPAAHRWHHREGMMLSGGLLHAFRQLNLTPAQQQSVHAILSAAHAQGAAERKAGGRPDFAVLSNPGDPNYATALQQLQTRMTSRLQEQSQTEQALYQVLTPEQQQQLPQILAGMKSRLGQRSAS
jgi:Spy/CpxP family protein refolding chaperone